MKDCDPRCGCGYVLTGSNLGGESKRFSYPGRGVAKCAKACNERPGCTSFEYNHGGAENYKCATYAKGDKNIEQGGQLQGWTSCLKGIVHYHQIERTKIVIG